MMSYVDHVTTGVRAIVARTLDVPPDALHDDADIVDDHRADSLILIELLTQLEKTFDVEIPPADLPGMRSVTTIVAEVARHLDPRP
jgi:acyl carrier protein